MSLDNMNARLDEILDLLLIVDSLTFDDVEGNRRSRKGLTIGGEECDFVLKSILGESFLIGRYSTRLVNVHQTVHALEGIGELDESE
jgi:hypothetical protein